MEVIMLDQNIIDKYEMTIGMECHVQLKTKTKLFAAVNNDARGAMPNTTVSEICFGLPGTLPVLNKEAVHLAVRAGHALNSKINLFSKFDRKHYFYPDLPMGYQITQFEHPTVGMGKVKLKLKSGDEIKVGITRAHLEADAGKLTHPTGENYSLVDLNRAGTPLIEIVSEPDIHSAEAAKAFAHELNLLMRYADVSDANLYYGNMRFDVNISIAPKGSKNLGTRAEIKNLNSFRAVESCVNYEFERQVELLEKGERVVQETRGWDDAKMITISQRSKEDAQDYRYMPEPDIPPIILTQDYINEVQKELPAMPAEIRLALGPLNLNYSQQETIVESPDLAMVIMEVIKSGTPLQHQKRIANWLQIYSSSASNEDDRDSSAQINLKPQSLIKLSEMVEAGSLNSSAAKDILAQLIIQDKDPEQLAEELNLIQISDSNELERIVDQVMKDNPKPVLDLKSGEEKAIGFIVGQVMKISGGKANPAEAQKIIRSKI
ncbi:MAG: aspartyl-tRNA(Asn)/glutamyl-tRNA(Gln) amidotransferase subunit [Patescibacteria group bacterium]|nr:aspartyl-tRNA(Asn)/glutamyl-tRNA(Gln) amidotransferase subunit [Patescibacteria group bacterium]